VAPLVISGVVPAMVLGQPAGRMSLSAMSGIVDVQYRNTDANVFPAPVAGHHVAAVYTTVEQAANLTN